jgi:hypothetical protein
MPGILITITQLTISTGLTVTQGQFQGIYQLCHFYFLQLFTVLYRIDKY